MEELMRLGWKFEFHGNQLETFSCTARKGEVELSAEAFDWWPLVVDIVGQCDEVEQKGVFQ